MWNWSIWAVWNYWWMVSWVYSWLWYIRLSHLIWLLCIFIIIVLLFGFSRWQHSTLINSNAFKRWRLLWLSMSSLWLKSNFWHVLVLTLSLIVLSTKLICIYLKDVSRIAWLVREVVVSWVLVLVCKMLDLWFVKKVLSWVLLLKKNVWSLFSLNHWLGHEIVDLLSIMQRTLEIFSLLCTLFSTIFIKGFI